MGRGTRPSIRAACRGLVVAAAVAAVSAGVAGCGGHGGEADGAAPPETRRPEALPAWTDSAPGVALDSVLRRVAVHVGPTRREARERRGEPESVTRRTSPNRHVKGAVDTVVTLTWEGARAQYLISGANGRELLASVRVDGRAALARLLPPPLLELPGLRRALEEPDRVDGQRWLYVCCPGRAAAEEALTFRLDEGRVVALEAGFYVD